MKKNIKSKFANVGYKRVYKAWVAPISEISEGGSWCGGCSWGVESFKKIRNEGYFNTREDAKEWAIENLNRWMVCAGRKIKSRKIVEVKQAKKENLLDVNVKGAVAFVFNGLELAIAAGGVEAKRVLICK